MSPQITATHTASVETAQGFNQPRKIIVPAMVLVGGLSIGLAVAAIQGHRAGGAAAPVLAAPMTPTATPPATSQSSAPVDQLIAPLAKRLAAEPNDASGWALLGKSYDYLKQPSLAADAYAQAIRYGNDDPAIAEALENAQKAQLTALLRGELAPTNTD